MSRIENTYVGLRCKERMIREIDDLIKMINGGSIDGASGVRYSKDRLDE
jgi:hypothetical protein